ncbi:peroxidase family protein [Pseudooctadecabacter jejudonensis]|uniref:Animal heme peroxidase n=1 Tax=Pseudooctadecabacter jejudonensis TaxID=1391910 RepID=A0A1Y5TEW3_9RHOB|nr:peroxidase family protein [Pseudooctadecabacter jejudonensis]SLN62279.1 Animal heme peroxidase [Pseudooctadecabacter jejudonensis]
MTTTPSPKISLNFASARMGQCCTVVDPRGLQLKALITDEALPRDLPKLDFTNPDWRRRCMNEKGHIPAGYTYLGQLIGHDAGDSRRADHIPHVQHSTTPQPNDADEDNKGVQIGPNGANNGRYNIIENPLAFETLYGSGPVTLHHLFDPITMLFRVNPRDPFAVNLSHGKNRHIYALYDVRNRDNLMVHQLAVTWMHYHNFVALTFEPDLKRMANWRAGLAIRTFVKARKFVLATWHRVIRDDYLATLLHPDVAAMSDEAMSGIPIIDEATLQHGVFRTFHCMPRADYQMKEAGTQSLLDLLATDLPKRSKGEESGWKLDLARMFDKSNETADKTGISASLTHALRHLIQRDFQTAVDAGPQRLGSPEMIAVIQALPQQTWRDQLTPDALSQAFNSVIAPHIGGDLPAAAFNRMPLYVLLMIEAHLYGGPGHLGPLSSVVFRRKISDLMDRIQYGQDDMPEGGPDELSSMIEITHTLRRNDYV